jgi:hypothetical protein
MARRIRAFIHESDEAGKRTKPAERVFAMLAINNKPPVLTINLPETRKTRHREINITIAELRRAMTEIDGGNA